MGDYMTIGETRETNGMRLHLYHGALKVTDIREAGRRGKTCPQFTLQHYSHGSDFICFVDRIANGAQTYDEARAIADASGLTMRWEVLRAIDVEPAADAVLTATFRVNGIQVGGALIKGYFSHSEGWTEPNGHTVQEHVTFYSNALNSTLLRRVLAGEVENNTDTMTDLYEHDRVRFQVGHPRYAEALLAARARERLVTLEARAAVPSSERTIGEVVVRDDAETNRVQIVFPGRPDGDTIVALKRAGFKWAPSVGAWQRMRGGGALAAAEAIARGVE